MRNGEFNDWDVEGGIWRSRSRLTVLCTSAGMLKPSLGGTVALMEAERTVTSKPELQVTWSRVPLNALSVEF